MASDDSSTCSSSLRDHACQVTAGTAAVDEPCQAYTCKSFGCLAAWSCVERHQQQRTFQSNAPAVQTPPWVSLMQHGISTEAGCTTTNNEYQQSSGSSLTCGASLG
mmetsp:Transcript_51028/g.101392  ORF Transcript_51028/g.101392 Transcript_51028/m.101392 type:complete len:106 (-) Transcript_51028:23-340(-)